MNETSPREAFGESGAIPSRFNIPELLRRAMRPPVAMGKGVVAFVERGGYLSESLTNERLTAGLKLLNNNVSCSTIKK